MSNSGSPGPAPTRYTVPATGPQMQQVRRNQSREERKRKSDQNAAVDRPAAMAIHQPAATPPPCGLERGPEEVDRRKDAAWRAPPGISRHQTASQLCSQQRQIAADKPGRRGWCTTTTLCPSALPAAIHPRNKSHHWGQAPERAPWRRRPLRRIADLRQIDRAWLPGNNSNGINQ